MSRAPVNFIRIRLFAIVFAGVACSSDVPTFPVPSSSEPLLYLVLSGSRTAPGRAAVDTVLYALLATTGTPFSSPARNATRFEMREASTGALYNWISATPKAELGFALSPANLDELANYILPRTTTVTGRGVDQLIYGATYTLDIETEGVQIHGSTTLPTLFDLTFVENGDTRVVAWPHVPGAVQYRVLVWHGAEPFFGAGGGTYDTSFVVPTRFTSGDSVRVWAADDNYRAMQADQIAETKRGRAGIDRGYGVFAAVTTSTSVLP